jgi:hypothetical protein
VVGAGADVIVGYVGETLVTAGCVVCGFGKVVVGILAEHALSARTAASMTRATIKYSFFIGNLLRAFPPPFNRGQGVNLNIYTLKPERHYKIQNIIMEKIG